MAKVEMIVYLVEEDAVEHAFLETRLPQPAGEPSS
jgi:hypothetical protein